MPPATVLTEGDGPGAEDGDRFVSPPDRGLLLHAVRKTASKAIKPIADAGIHLVPTTLGYPAVMWILLLEALGALALLAFIVWWTMFSGRRRGELQAQDGSDDPPAPKP